MTACALAAALIAAAPPAAAAPPDHRDGAVRMTAAVWVDQTRDRQVPVAIFPQTRVCSRPKRSRSRSAYASSRSRATTHNDMWDAATERQRAEMLSHIHAFLNESGH
ncbi:MAG: hypothetical protein M3Q55_18030 [Acidobacteriota bacterium]|nr:hypothetical protein [Acidobacteriota bacterium]